jgi:hypothetical protein
VEMVHAEVILREGSRGCGASQAGRVEALGPGACGQSQGNCGHGRHGRNPFSKYHSRYFSPGSECCESAYANEF